MSIETGISPIGYHGGMSLTVRPEKKGMVRCRECHKAYNEAIYPMCPFCGKERKK